MIAANCLSWSEDESENRDDGENRIKKFFLPADGGHGRALMHIVLVFLLLGMWGGEAFGVVIVRGPYLQIGTSNSVIVRWRTDVPVVGRVQFGPAEGSFTGMVTGSS